MQLAIEDIIIKLLIDIMVTVLIHEWMMISISQHIKKQSFGTLLLFLNDEECKTKNFHALQWDGLQEK